MQVCPNCAREHDERDVMCVYCGYAAATPGKIASRLTPTPAETPASPALPTPSPADVQPDLFTLDEVVADSFKLDAADAEAARRLEQAVTAASELEQSAAAPAPANAVPPRSKPTSRPVVVLGAVAIVGVAIVALVGRPRHSDAPTAAAPAAPQAARVSQAAARPAPATPPAQAAAVPIESIPVEVPKWKPSGPSRWARDGSRTMSFEVEAERDVAVYRDRVRPILAVRCVARATEVFVVLQSAASIENASDTHTVKIGFDSGADAEEHWLDSLDKQALFAPDGHALVARLAAARRLRFSFQPFNAAPATVEFDVHGLDQPLAMMSKACAPSAPRAPKPRG